MKDKLIKMVQFVQANDQDRYNPETYQVSKLEHDENGHFNWSYILGNLYAEGAEVNKLLNFQIYKDHSTWQIWVWSIGMERPEYNQFNAPIYKYQEVIEFIEKTF